MSVYYYEPQYSALERFLESALGRPQQQAENTNTAPAVLRPRYVPHSTFNLMQLTCHSRMDLHEDAEKNTVTASFELPGLKKEDITIDIHDGRLTISGETKVSEEHEENGYAVRERRYGKFSRALRLPQGIKVG